MSSTKFYPVSNKVLIISPYFPPSNTADMQRVRMSLPYFKQYGWDAEVVVVDERYADLQKDDLLMQGIPADIRIYKVRALNKARTSKIGLGSMGWRSLWHYRQKVNQLLRTEKYNLIYFSTTQFPVCVLGAYWKKKFGIPYVIDMQDPWHSDYYLNKPKDQQPPKYWLTYRLHKFLEPIAMTKVDGLISVSQAYINTLKSRYPIIRNIPAATIPFGAFKPDLDIAVQNASRFNNLLDDKYINIAYIGRGGNDMLRAISPVFKALQTGLVQQPEIFSKLRFYFIGTSYTPAGKGEPTIMPLARQYHVQDSVIEVTDRISYYHTLITLQQADALFIPGSDDPQYSASKIYPYLLTNKPLLAIFNTKSPALSILAEYGAGFAFSFDDTDIETNVNAFLTQLHNHQMAAPDYNLATITKYGAENLTKLQCDIFDSVINNSIK